MLQLASTSSRRREILASLGFRFDVVEVETDERPLNGELPSDLVLRLATAKAEALNCGSCVLGADTVVVLEGRVFGKPRDAEDAVSSDDSTPGLFTPPASVGDAQPVPTRTVATAAGRPSAFFLHTHCDPVPAAGSHRRVRDGGGSESQNTHNFCNLNEIIRSGMIKKDILIRWVLHCMGRLEQEKRQLLNV